VGCGSRSFAAGGAAAGSVKKALAIRVIFNSYIVCACALVRFGQARTLPLACIARQGAGPVNEAVSLL